VRLDRPLCPLGLPFGEVTPLALATTRKRLDEFLRTLPIKLQRGYLEYKFVLEELVDFTYTEYNRLHPDNQIEPPMTILQTNSTSIAHVSPSAGKLVTGSNWYKYRRHRLVRLASIIHASNSTSDLQIGHMGHMMNALLRDGSLGRWTHDKQLRAITEVLTRQSRKIDELERANKTLEQQVQANKAKISLLESVPSLPSPTMSAASRCTSAVARAAQSERNHGQCSGSASCVRIDGRPVSQTGAPERTAQVV
jgi:hypothetical protein